MSLTLADITLIAHMSALLTWREERRIVPGYRIRYGNLYGPQGNLLLANALYW